MPAIEVEHLSFTYENRSEPALADINLKIDEKEFILLAGPSGSGKSTLIRCLNGLIPHRYLGEYHGVVRVKGVSVAGSAFLNLSLVVGTLIQEVDKQIVSSSVEDEVAFGPCNLALPRTEIKMRVDNALNETGIQPLRKRFTFALSGGQKQRLAIADILAMESEIILFDEPFANLDSNGVRLMQDVLKRFHAEGKTIIVSEHRTEEVLRAGPTRVIIIDQGKVVSDSSDPRSLGDFAGIIKIPAEYALKGELNVKAILVNIDALIKSMPQFPAKDRELIRVEDLSVIYSGNIRALDGVSFTIRQGERVAILGNNGAGKSTLALAIAGLVRPASGRVFISGKDTQLMSVSEISRDVALVFQSPFSMLFSKTVRDELEFGAKNVGFEIDEISKTVPKVASECGIEQVLDISPFATSFGEKKRICVASVLAMQPKCIILDEPTAGQDYRSYTRFMRFMISLESLDSFIIITHDPDLVVEYTDRSIILKDGKIMADGPTSSLLARQDILEQGAIRQTSLIELCRKLTNGRIVLPLERLVSLQSGSLNCQHH